MKKQKIAFSLLEVVVASLILTITVFWTFKLIWENQKLISNASNYKNTTSLFIPLIECIKHISYSWFDDKSEWKTHYINFWDDLNWCEIWKNKTKINNIEYELSWKIIKHEIWKYITFNLKIISDYSKLEKEFNLLK